MKVQKVRLTLSHRLNKEKNPHLWVWKPFWDSMLSSAAGRLLLRVCLCVDEYRWTGLLMAAVGAVTSPSILSVVTGPLPLLRIVSRERAHPEDHTAALYFSPANDDNKTQQEQGYGVQSLILPCIYVFMVYLYYWVFERIKAWRHSKSISAVVNLVLDSGLQWHLLLCKIELGKKNLLLESLKSFYCIFHLC